MCPVSGGGEEGPMVHGKYLGAVLPRAAFLAKSVLMGERRVGFKWLIGKAEEQETQCSLSALVLKTLPASPPSSCSGGMAH